MIGARSAGNTIMKLRDVPQDPGIGGNMSEVCYAVNEEGRYVVMRDLATYAIVL